MWPSISFGFVSIFISMYINVCDYYLGLIAFTFKVDRLSWSNSQWLRCQSKRICTYKFVRLKKGLEFSALESATQKETTKYETTIQVASLFSRTHIAVTKSPKINDWKNGRSDAKASDWNQNINNQWNTWNSRCSLKWKTTKLFVTFVFSVCRILASSDAWTASTLEIMTIYGTHM